ncbi:MAG: hypothetical protein AABO41_26825 [Acidobacteriota bacterium]
MTSSETHQDEPTNVEECFVVMPFSDADGYLPGHFRHVYDDLFAPACDKAGFRPVRADQVRETNLIHLDILQKLLRSPMALCDLSSQNPNVLFELGLRQAFDQPVVLVREIGTADIFDIGPLRYTEYHKELIYREVIEDRKKIAAAIAATREAFKSGQGINSMIRLLSLSQPASLADLQEADRDPLLQIVRAELSELRSDFKAALRLSDASQLTRVGREIEIREAVEEIASRQLDKLQQDLLSISASLDPETGPWEERRRKKWELIKDAIGLLTIMRRAVGEKSELLSSITALMKSYNDAETRYLDEEIEGLNPS